MKEKRICRKTTELLDKLTRLKNDLIMVSCDYFRAEEAGYKGRITYKYKFSISLINSDKHIIETERFKGSINAEEAKSLPMLLACEWYVRKGRERYGESTFLKK